MSVKEIMTTRIVTVEMDDTLAKVKEIFDNVKFHHLLVIESHKLFGVISDRDLLKSISPHLGSMGESLKDRQTLCKKVHQVMTRKLVTLPPDASIAQAIQIFISKNISCIPIVNNNFSPLGIVTWRDVLRGPAVREHNQ